MPGANVVRRLFPPTKAVTIKLEFLTRRERLLCAALDTFGKSLACACVQVCARTHYAQACTFLRRKPTRSVKFSKVSLTPERSTTRAVGHQ